MGTYFLDTSAIVKRYFLEQGHQWVVTLCDPEQNHILYISQAALVEVVAAICRKAREQHIADDARDELINTFRRDSQAMYVVWPVTNALYTAAGNMCRSHRLRAYDAVQLACVLALREEMQTGEGESSPLPVFVCADDNLVKIATVERLDTENPNLFP